MTAPGAKPTGEASELPVRLLERPNPIVGLPPFRMASGVDLAPIQVTHPGTERCGDGRVNTVMQVCDPNEVAALKYGAGEPRAVEARLAEVRHLDAEVGGQRHEARLSLPI